MSDVHAWSSMTTVTSIVMATIVVVVLLPLTVHLLMHLEPRQPARCLLTFLEFERGDRFNWSFRDLREICPDSHILAFFIFLAFLFCDFPCFFERYCSVFPWDLRVRPKKKSLLFSGLLLGARTETFERQICLFRGL